MNAFESVLANADYFVLLLFRMGGLVMTSPVFGRTTIPTLVRIGFIAVITFLLFISVPQTGTIEYTTLMGFALICAGEILMGVALAFITNIFFTLTYVAGQMIDMQIGFGIVNVYDVQNNTQIPIIGNILNTALLLIFFGVNGHHRLIEILKLTLDRIPVGNISFAPEIGIAAVEAFCLSFMLGVMVAVPVVASGIILEVSFGMLIRTVPQMNMFVVGIPIKIVVGFIMLLFTLPIFINFSERIFSEMFSSIEKVFSAFLVGI